MKLEINWTPGPPSKPGKWLIAIIGSEDAIPAVFGQSGKIFSWTNSDVKYQPDHISFHASWPQYPRERDQRWIECDRRTWEMMRGDVREVHKQIVAGGQDEYIAEKYLNGKPICRMEINM
ncbi:hypothetical protein RZS08_43685, partial [Arthrospira platensis SPKY1]|nr:hypothetical protein [Arthrospira platensis SPKY1]